MRRGALWTASGGSYAGKPRPVVIVQDDRFDETASITVAPLTSDTVEAPLFRVRIEPTETNGLRIVSHVMADKITTIPKHRLGYRLGMLGSGDMTRLNRAIIVFLGMAG